MEKCKQLEESNRLLTQSNQQLSQQMMSIDQRLQAFFQMQQASGSGSQPPFTHPSQHNEEDGEAEEEEEEGEEEEEDLGDWWVGCSFPSAGGSSAWFFMKYIISFAACFPFPSC